MKPTKYLALITLLGLIALVQSCSKDTSDPGKAEIVSEEAAKTTTGYDDGSQLLNPFRINYAGYLPNQEKIAVYLSSDEGPISWELRNGEGKVVAKGETNERRVDDFASGDSFFLIDFSSYREQGDNYYLSVEANSSSPFAISNDPYGRIKYKFYDFFRDHRRQGDVFNRAVDNWTDHEVTFNFIADAGDQGYYPVNAAEAQWSLINLLEEYPSINDYYQKHSAEMSTVYDELVYFSDPLDKIIFPGEKLAVAKFHTFTNTTYALCPGAPGTSGTCISKPESKATYSLVRTAAAMARLHKKYGTEAEVQANYSLAKLAFDNAQSEDPLCQPPSAFGGEGGYYPNNDNWSLWRDPRSHRDPCASGPEADPSDNNINDDIYAALVELFLTARALGLESDADAYKTSVEAHPHHLRVDHFYWGAVSPEATLSLLTHRPEGMDLTKAEQGLIEYAEKVIGYQQVGYPGVTFDVKSDFWDSNDKDDIDNNFRWGSNRMQLNDARLVMAAAELEYERQNFAKAATYTNAVLKVLDQMSGTNAVALAMYTAKNSPHIEQAVSRTHDALVSDDIDGKFALGPNNWTNSDDPDMPAFGSQPGMKMFALTGTGWASREISIDGNASLVPVVYFATEVAPRILQAARAEEP